MTKRLRPHYAWPLRLAPLVATWLCVVGYDREDAVGPRNLFFDPGRTDAFGWNAQGTVFNRAGKKYSYLESLLGVFDPDPFRELHSRYSLSIN